MKGGGIGSCPELGPSKTAARRSGEKLRLLNVHLTLPGSGRDLLVLFGNNKSLGTCLANGGA